MDIKAFRAFVNSVRNDQSYFPVVTECKGACNIAMGATELLASGVMKMYKDPNVHQRLANRHFNMGYKSIIQGFKELAPGLAVGLVVYHFAPLLSRNWNSLPGKIEDNYSPSSQQS